MATWTSQGIENVAKEATRNYYMVQHFTGRPHHEEILLFSITL